MPDKSLPGKSLYLLKIQPKPMSLVPFGRLFLPVLAMLYFLPACQEPAHEPPDADALIAQAIEAHGGAAYDSSLVSFRFRGRDYRATRQGGNFVYERAFEDDSLGEVVDVLTNEGFFREVEGEEVALPDTLAQAYRESVNSVIYFALLPYPLQDPSVQASYVGRESLGKGVYDLVEVTFKQADGGTDFQDVFRYWFHTETHTMDYLAYSYQTEGGGLRFREAYNPREVGGIRFQDYVNYQADYQTHTLADLSQLFAADQLEELSRIEIEAVRVSSLKR